MRLADKNVTEVFEEEIKKAQAPYPSSPGKWDGSVNVLLYQKTDELDVDEESPFGPATASYDVVLTTLHMAELDEHYVLLSKAKQGVPAKIMKLEDYQSLGRRDRIVMGSV